jgi:hypothetical protein
MATRIWTEVAMNRIHYLRRIGRFAAALAGLAAARAAFGATPAFAVRHPKPGPPNPVPAAPVQIHTIVTGGMPGRQPTLTAVAAALSAAIMAASVDRPLAPHRLRPAPPRPH